MLVDAHCHLIGRHLENGSLEPLLDRARRAGVGGLMAVGTDLVDSAAVLQLAQDIPFVQASVGIHPHEAKTWDHHSPSALEALASSPHVRFIGETGLDWHYDLSPRDVQECVFRSQIRLALKVRKPLMIHTREAGEATLRILEEEGASAVGGVFHCFSESQAFAAQALDLGFHLSFSGILTFKTATAIQAVARWAPLDRLLVETDSPYLAPVPFRGKPNEPAHVVHVAAALASLRGITPQAVADRTTRNLEALCGWPAA